MTASTPFVVAALPSAQDTVSKDTSVESLAKLTRIAVLCMDVICAPAASALSIPTDVMPLASMTMIALMISALAALVVSALREEVT